jgi:hypothetical protein
MDGLFAGFFGAFAVGLAAPELTGCYRYVIKLTTMSLC